MPVDGDWGFHETRAQHAVDFFEKGLRHTKGRWAGKPFILTDWQRDDIVRPLFGTMLWNAQYEEWVRAYNIGWVELGRGNGKSEMLAGIALYLLCADGEESAEVYGAASDREQGALVYDVAARMVQLSPSLRKRLLVRDSRKTIVHQASNSFYRVIAADAAGNLGQAPHGIVFDEIIAQPDNHLFDALRTGMGKRTQPLMICATTAGNNPASFAAKEHDFMLQVGDQPKLAPSRFVFMRNTPKEADPWDEDAWHIANPGLGDFLNVQTLRDEALEAQADPTKENAFRQYRLNQWVSQVTRWMPLSLWDSTAGMVDRQKLIGRAAIGGLDLAATTDLASLAWLFPDDDGGFDVLWRFWINEAQAEDLSRRTGGLVGQWVKEGFITVTEGEVIDYDVIHQDIFQDAKDFDVRSLRIDRWNSTATVSWMEVNAIPAHTVGAGYGDFSPGMKELFKMVKEQKLRHGGNPVARWNVNSLDVKIDPNENIKPVKPKDRQATSARIDGAVALIYAVGEWLRLESLVEAEPGVISLDDYV
jgi:phage terminase large subunit-like protein